MIDRLNKHLSLTRQCQLLGLSRSSLYYQPAPDNTEDLALMALIDRQFLETPYYGSRKMTAWLRREGHGVNRKRVRRLMRQMGLPVIWQKPNTSKPNPEHKTYPYLLRGLTIERPLVGHGKGEPVVGELENAVGLWLFVRHRGSDRLGSAES